MLGGQVRTGPSGYIGFDMTAALALASARGICLAAAAELLPVIEGAAIAGMNQQLRDGDHGS